MDPYLERHWGDVHADIIALTRTALNRVLPDDLIARMEERVAINVDFGRPKEARTYITILETNGGELVTVIECLSPSNKLAGPDRDRHRQKRSELLAAHVNVVEIDLLRQGSRREFLQPMVLPARVTPEYATIVWPADAQGRAEFYPMALHGRLPAIRIPLRPSDTKVVLDLQGVIDQAYENGRYDHTDYTQRCEPPLTGDDEAWAKALIESGKR